MTHTIDSIVSFQLDNGLSVVVIPTQSPVLALQLWVKTGSIHEESYLGAATIERRRQNETFLPFFRHFYRRIVTNLQEKK